jgi:hypothetical protein
MQIEYREFVNTCSFPMIMVLGDLSLETTQHLRRTIEMDQWVVYSNRTQIFENVVSTSKELLDVIDNHKPKAQSTLGIIFDDLPLKPLRLLIDFHNIDRFRISIIFLCSDIFHIYPDIRANLDYIFVFNCGLETCKKLYLEYLCNEKNDDKLQEFTNLQEEKIVVINNSFKSRKWDDLLKICTI